MRERDPRVEIGGGLKKEASSYDTSNDGDSERESEGVRGRPAGNALSSFCITRVRSRPINSPISVRIAEKGRKRAKGQRKRR